MLTAKGASGTENENKVVRTGSHIQLTGGTQYGIIINHEKTTDTSIPDDAESSKVVIAPKERNKRPDSPDADKVLQLLLMGSRVKEVCDEMKYSEAHVDNITKIRRDMSAMEYGWIRWQMVSGMYHGKTWKNGQSD